MHDSIFELHQYKFFFKKFRDFEYIHLQDRLQRELGCIIDLFSKYEKIKPDLSKLYLMQAPNYNIFTTLKIGHYEARVHTPFLAHLFRPNETHLQGRLFFNNFLNEVFDSKFKLNNISAINIAEEYSFEFFDNKKNKDYKGQIDILVRFKYNNEYFAVIIENKIYHQDTEDQLYKYYRFVQEIFKISEDKIFMLYLKPNRGAPEVKSLEDNIYLNLKREGLFKEISYKMEVQSFLSKSLPAITSNPVKNIIHQYLKTIQNL